MPRHLFLTGDVQVGKSTVIRNVLRALDVPVGGFRTVAGSYMPDGSSAIYLVPAGTADFVQCPENCVAERHGAGCRFGFSSFPAVFDTVGSELLRVDGICSLILMDELGFLEKDASGFQEAVFSCLDGPVPVLGVVRDRESAFLDRVRAHPEVAVVRVTRENRDRLPAEITGIWGARVGLTA